MKFEKEIQSSSENFPETERELELESRGGGFFYQAIELKMNRDLEPRANACCGNGGCTCNGGCGKNRI